MYNFIMQSYISQNHIFWEVLRLFLVATFGATFGSTLFTSPSSEKCIIDTSGTMNVLLTANELVHMYVYTKFAYISANLTYVTGQTLFSHILTRQPFWSTSIIVRINLIANQKVALFCTLVMVALLILLLSFNFNCMSRSGRGKSRRERGVLLEIDLWYCLRSNDTLRVQNEQFSEEKGFILRYTEKEV